MRRMMDAAPHVPCPSRYGRTARDVRHSLYTLFISAAAGIILPLAASGPLVLEKRMSVCQRIGVTDHFSSENSDLVKCIFYPSNPAKAQTCQIFCQALKSQKAIQDIFDI